MVGVGGGFFCLVIVKKWFIATLWVLAKKKAGKTFPVKIYMIKFNKVNVDDCCSCTLNTNKILRPAPVFVFVPHLLRAPYGKLYLS